MTDSSHDVKAPLIERSALRQQFGTDDNLRLRQDTHDQFSVPKVDFAAWVLTHYAWRGDERVLDVGTGSGRYYNWIAQHRPQVAYVGLDVFEGMLNGHRGRGRVLSAEAENLPFADGTFDVVMANHMLYLLPDIDMALREIRRVLTPKGVLIAATNSVQTMPEFNALFRRAVTLLSTPGGAYNAGPPASFSSFTLENGPQILRRHFFAIVRHDLPQALVFETAEPALAYLESLRSVREPHLPERVQWEDVMDVMREQIDRVIAHFGELVVQKISGTLIASDQGGFIGPFSALRER
jgi:ubiquinone/menaquinone biosynthesis C-methylase UbiE